MPFHCAITILVPWLQIGRGFGSPNPRPGLTDPPAHRLQSYIRVEADMIVRRCRQNEEDFQAWRSPVDGMAKRDVAAGDRCAFERSFWTASADEGTLALDVVARRQLFELEVRLERVADHFRLCQGGDAQRVPVARDGPILELDITRQQRLDNVAETHCVTSFVSLATGCFSSVVRNREHSVKRHGLQGVDRLGRKGLSQQRSYDHPLLTSMRKLPLRLLCPRRRGSTPLCRP